MTPRVGQRVSVGNHSDTSSIIELGSTLHTNLQCDDPECHTRQHCHIQGGGTNLKKHDPDYNDLNHPTHHHHGSPCVLCQKLNTVGRNTLKMTSITTETLWPYYLVWDRLESLMC